MEGNKAVFLDRDGVINHDPGDYTRSLGEFHVLPTVFEALKTLQDAGYMLILITNQGGIAKGQYTHEAFTKFIGISFNPARMRASPSPTCTTVRITRISERV